MNLKKIMTFMIACVLTLVVLPGCIEQQDETSGTQLIVIPAATGSSSNNPKYAMASYYQTEKLVINASTEQYQLPLGLDEVVNIDAITSWHPLNNDQEDLLSSNGFLVIDYGYENDTIQPYKDLKDQNIPIFITTDTLLHLYHVQFNEILKGIEEREFFSKVLNISKILFEQSKEDYGFFTNETLREAARRNIAYFAVGLTLLQTPTVGYENSENIEQVDFSIPSYVEDEVSEEISYIENHSGFSVSPIFHYQEDYSQYVPRGHYTRSEKLKRYFKTMMWYGRIAFLMKGGEPHCQGCEFLISEKDAKIATIQASLISTYLFNLQSDGENLDELWNRIYAVTSFFVGTADDLTPYEYIDSIKEIYGSEFNAFDFVNEIKLLKFKTELLQLRSPEIYGGTGNIMLIPPITKEKINDALEKTKGMRLMGQRFIPDSYMFQHLTTTTGEYIGDSTPFTMCITGAGRPARCFPRGLDIMAVLGSQRAYEILEQEGDTEYEGVNTSYDKQLACLRQNFSDSNINVTEWNHNLYWSWIYTLKTLIKEFNTNYPAFMQNSAWWDKELQTALASWTELRHDTILYAKQSYTFLETSVPPTPEKTKGYVEPIPEFYSRLHGLTRMTKDGLMDMNVLNDTEETRIENLEMILSRLIDISKNELEGKKLSDDDYDFIRNFGETIENVVTGVTERGQQTTIVADVHSDANTMKCLEEGVGYLDLVLVTYNVPDIGVTIGAGPVFSYYEFKQPMDQRLTDEEWTDMLKNNEQPSRPDWIDSFYIE